jgi:sulfur-carrier protein
MATGLRNCDSSTYLRIRHKQKSITRKVAKETCIKEKSKQFFCNLSAKEYEQHFFHNTLRIVVVEVKAKIHYLGLVKTYTNKTEEDLTLQSDSKVSSVFDQLAASFGKPFNPEIYDPAKKEVKPMFTVMVNGIIIGQLEGVDTKLKDGDQIILMPLMTGG